MVEIIKLKNHPHNVCRGQRRISGALEHLGLYQCVHGITATLWEYDADGDGQALAGLFETEAEARDALASAKA